MFSCWLLGVRVYLIMHLLKTFAQMGGVADVESSLNCGKYRFDILSAVKDQKQPRSFVAIRMTIVQ